MKGLLALIVLTTLSSAGADESRKSKITAFLNEGRRTLKASPDEMGKHHGLLGDRLLSAQVLSVFVGVTSVYCTLFVPCICACRVPQALQRNSLSTSLVWPVQPREEHLQRTHQRC